MNEISKLRRWAMWFCASSFYAYQFILRISPGAIATDLMSSLAIDACTLGAVISYYYNGYALMQLPTGVIIDRLGLRAPLSVACLLCALGSLIFTYGSTPFMYSFARAVMGIGSAFGFLGCIKVASQNFAPQRLALLISLTLALGTIGATFGGAPFAKVAALIGWREAYKILSLCGFALSVCVIIFFYNSNTTAQSNTARTARSENIMTGIIDVMRNPQTWIYGFYGFMMYVPLSGFVDLWAVPFIELTYRLDCTGASGVVTTSYLGVAIGSPFWSSYVTRVQSYKKGMFLSALITSVCFAIVIYIPQIDCLRSQAVNITYIFMALGGAASGGQFVAFAGIAQLNLTHRTAMATGIHNMFCMFSGVIMMPLVGKLLDKLANLSPLTGKLIYSSESYQIALLMVPVSVFFALVSTYFMKENYPHKSTLTKSERPLKYHAQT